MKKYQSTIWLNLQCTKVHIYSRLYITRYTAETVLTLRMYSIKSNSAYCGKHTTVNIIYLLYT